MARTISSTTSGPIALGTSDDPLSITSTGQVTSTGTADGIDGAAGTVWTIANSGTIGAATGFGIYLAGAGVVNSGGTITGKDGVIIHGGGSVTNTGFIKAVGAIGGGPWVGSGVFLTGAAGTVSNGGTINGQAYGVAVDAGGLVTNTGSIVGGEDGVRVFGLGTMINSGTVVATADDGVGLHSGGSVTNLAGASIACQGTQGAGIYIGSGLGTVTNSGAVSGIDYGVDVAAGGIVTNNAGASITGHRGVNVQGGIGTVNNSGIISGPNDFGVGLSAGGQVTNGAGGSISGFWGIAAYNVAATITNNGTISGTNHAVRFSGSGANRLVMGATGVLIGDVVGSTAGGSSNTLELSGGTGTLSGLSGGAGSITANGQSSAFSSFNTLAVDTGAAWTLTGRNSIATVADNGSLTIASGGSLTATGAVDPASSGLFSLAGNAVLDFAADVGPGVQVAFQGPTGVLELADIAGGVVRRFGGTIAGLNAGTSTSVPTNAVNIQSAVTGAVLVGNTITVANGATTVASLVLNAAPAAGTSVATRADPTLGGYDVFLTNSGNPLPTVTWSPGTETGVEGGAIALGTIAPSGTGLTSVLVSGIPVGATLSDGTNSFVSPSATSVSVLGWNYAKLSIQPVNDANFSLSVQATDGSGNVSAAASEAVAVNPRAPTVAPGTVSGTVGQAIGLNLGITPNGLSGDSNSLSTVTIGSIPNGATLSNTNGNTLTVSGGSITFSASQIAAGILNGLAITPSSAGNFSLNLSAAEQDAQSDLSSTASGTETLTVTGGLPTVTWSPGTETGVEGGAIRLGTITPSGTGLTSVLVSGIPVNAKLSDGTNSFTASPGTTSFNVLGWNYATLSITPPASDANFALSVQATDGSGNVSAAAGEAVTVNPLAPTVGPVAISGSAGQAIALKLGITPNGFTGDSNNLSTVTIGSIPAGATLSNTNGNTLAVSGGGITFSAAQIAAGYLNGLAITPSSAGNFSLNLSAAEQDAQGDLSSTASGTETLTVGGTGGAGGTISTSVSGPITLTAANNPLTITSTGTITTTGSGDGVSGASGTSWTVSNNGTISASTGSASGVRLRGPGTVTNGGLITTSGTAYGVGLDGGGTVTNTSTIIGGEDGVRITTGIGTLINSGSIASKIDDGIGFFAGGLVANGAGGAISNLGTKGAGVYITGGLGTVTNSGTITGIDYAVDLARGGSVRNDAGAIITSHRGVNIQGGTGTVNNSGSISGPTDFGVRLSAGGQVTNATGGSISGPLGVAVYSAAGTVTNNGTLSGTSHAVTFAGSGANRLVVGGTGVLIGDVVGSTASGSSNMLELAGGTGTLSGLSGGAGSITENGHSSAFSSFNTLAVDTGAAWTLTGKDSIANLLDNGSVTIANGGSIDVTSVVDPASAGVFLLTGSSSLEVAAALGTNTQMSFIGSGRLTVDKFGSFGTNVGSTAYAGPSLMNFAADDAIDILQFSATGDTLSYNAPTGVLQISNSASQMASLSFQNASLGSGAFHAASDGGSGILITHS